MIYEYTHNIIQQYIDLYVSNKYTFYYENSVYFSILLFTVENRCRYTYAYFLPIEVV